MEKRKRVAVITGASSGIGWEFVLQIAQKYKSIQEFWLIARRRERLERLKTMLAGRPVKILELDLCIERDLQKYQEALRKEKPRVRMLVNAAGFGILGTVEKQKIADSTGMVDVNCRALTFVTRCTLPYLDAGSQIIQMASSAAFLPQPQFAVYAATKSYVLSFSRALGKELKPQRITVTAVCPGPVNTEFFTVAQKYQMVKLYKKLAYAKADRVVCKALADARCGKSVSVYGGLMKLFRVVAKFAPADWLMFFVR